MTFSKTLAFGVVAATAVLGGCADSYYDNGYYGRGIATGYYSGPVGFGADYYAGYGYPGYGFYNDFYYPGYGVYVFDREGHRREWNENERAHWAARGEWRENHLMAGGRYDKRRDHAYIADRDAAFRNYRHAGPPGGNEHRGEGERRR